MRLLEAFAGVWLERLLDALSPPSCAACAGPRSGAPPFCITCGEPAPLEPTALGGVPLLVAGRYQPPLSSAVRRFKFEGRSELALGLSRLLAPRLAPFLAPHRPEDACFVPVPLHRARLVERGYNQSALLARCLARAVGGRCETRVLERHRSTDQQARLGRDARLANVADAFGCRAGKAPGVSVLVDDVVTTGATALACLEALKKAGSEVRAVVALARAEGAR
jgi:ComF family protein